VGTTRAGGGELKEDVQDGVLGEGGVGRRDLDGGAGCQTAQAARREGMKEAFMMPIVLG
jgi:hypothetical protein